MLRNVVKVHLLGRGSWLVWCALGLAFYLFRDWYFSSGYLVFGDLPVVRWQTVLPAAFALWNPTGQLGFVNSTHVFVRELFGVLFGLKVPEAIAEASCGSTPFRRCCSWAITRWAIR